MAAESHVDRSITNPLEFVMTNVIGTVNLLNAKQNTSGKIITKENVSIMCSTDEVFGALLGDEGFLQRPLSMTHILLTLLPKHHQTIL